MNLTSAHFRILAFLDRGRKLVWTPGSIMASMNLTDRRPFDNAIDDLSGNNLIERTKHDITITTEGGNALRGFQSEMRQTAKQYIYQDYELAILYFLDKHDWGVKSGEFPALFIEQCPLKPRGGESPQAAFETWLYRKSALISQSQYGEYTLTDEGRESLYDRLDLERDRESARVPVNLHVGDNVQGNQHKGDINYQEVIAQKDSELSQLDAQLKRLQIRDLRYKKWFAFFGAIGGAILTLFVEHFTEIINFLFPAK